MGCVALRDAVRSGALPRKGPTPCHGTNGRFRVSFSGSAHARRPPSIEEVGDVEELLAGMARGEIPAE